MSGGTMVQAALRAALAPLAPVYDTVPVDAAAPYLTIGPDLMTDWSHKTGQGREHRVQVGVWDDAPSHGRVKTLLAAVEAAVLPLAATTGGWRIASVLFVRSFITRDPDGWSQGLAEFRIRSEEI